MKARHWFNLIFVGLIAGVLTFLAYRWALTSYAAPTCQRYAESKGLTYVGFIPPDPGTYGTGTSHKSRDGNCQLRDAKGEVQTYSLVAASGSDFGAPFLVSFALDWQITFMGSFFVVALILAMLIRIVTGKPAS